MQEVITYIEKSGIKLVEAIVVVIAGFMLINYLRKKDLGQKFYSKVDPTLVRFGGKLLTFLMYILVLDIAISILGIPMTSVIALLASASVAVSLAMQGVLSNFIGGIMILLLKPFKANDYVDVGSAEGSVNNIGLFYTELITPDNRLVSIPNSSLTNTSIVNYSALKSRRVEVKFGVGYSTDIEEVTNLLTRVAGEQPYVLTDPAPVVHLISNDDSAMTYHVRVWCEPAHYWDVSFGLLRAGTLALQKANIEIPFPQMDVHIKQ